jgi:hypothetical protein
MDQSVIKEFLSSGRTIIYDTMAVKSHLPKTPKNEPKMVEQTVNLNPLENLLARMKDEKVSKQQVIEVFQKIIDVKESEI